MSVQKHNTHRRLGTRIEYIYLINLLKTLLTRATQFIYSKYSYNIVIPSLDAKFGLSLLAFHRAISSLRFSSSVRLQIIQHNGLHSRKTIFFRIGHPQKVARHFSLTVTFLFSVLFPGATDWSRLLTPNYSRNLWFDLILFYFFVFSAIPRSNRLKEPFNTESQP